MLLGLMSWWYSLLFQRNERPIGRGVGLGPTLFHAMQDDDAIRLECNQSINTMELKYWITSSWPCHVIIYYYARLKTRTICRRWWAQASNHTPFLSANKRFLIVIGHASGQQWPPLCRVYAQINLLLLERLFAFVFVFFFFTTFFLSSF